MRLTHDHYFKYDELTRELKKFAADFPSFAQLESLGKTEQGRDIWIMTLTDSSTGPHSEKPAFWVDGNTHATELAGCQACVHLIDTLLSRKTEKRIAELLKSQTFYIIPRISADGAEHVLTTGQFVRSSPVFYPGDFPHENFESKDLDGNGSILMMRIPDPSGHYKISKNDPRLMIPRDAHEFSEEDGPFYHLFPEGEFKNFDGFRRQHVETRKYDLNRQAPSQFSPKEYGAGPLPLALKEARVLAEAFIARPNVVGAHTHHTFGGFLLRPSSLRPDADIPTMDLEIFKIMGKLGEKLTGYKAMSIYHDFKYDPKKVTTGAWDDWHYDHRGVFSWTPEIWSLASQAGVQLEKALELYQGTTEEALLKMIKWCDLNAPKDSYYQDWTKFEHPQLGAVEIGGWKTLYSWSNPPHRHLKAELEKLTAFSLAQAQMSPHVVVQKIIVTEVEKNIFKLQVRVQNQGFLPTYISESAKSLNVHRTPTAQVLISPSQKIVDGKAEFHTKHLGGRSEALPWVSPIWGNDVANSHEEQLTWIIAGPGEVSFAIHYVGGGVVRGHAVLK